MIWRRGKNSGLEKRKLFSIVIVGLMMTAGLAILPFAMPNASAYTTPDATVTWTFDDLVMNSGGAVTGPFGGPYTVHESITIMPSDRLQLIGGEMVTIAPGMGIVVAGDFDGIMGSGSSFTSAGPGNWNGFVVFGGTFWLSGATIMDASIGLADYHLGGACCSPPVNKILAGFDPVEIDRMAAGFLNLNWKHIRHLS